MMNYETLFYRLLDYAVHEVGLDIEVTLNEIGVENLHEQEEIINNFEDIEEDDEDEEE